MDTKILYLEVEQKWIYHGMLQKELGEKAALKKENEALKARIEELESPGAKVRGDPKSGGKLGAVDGPGEKDRPIPPAGGAGDSKPEQPGS